MNTELNGFGYFDAFRIPREDVADCLSGLLLLFRILLSPYPGLKMQLCGPGNSFSGRKTPLNCTYRVIFEWVSPDFIKAHSSKLYHRFNSHAYDPSSSTSVQGLSTDVLAISLLRKFSNFW